MSDTEQDRPTFAEYWKIRSEIAEKYATKEEMRDAKADFERHYATKFFVSCTIGSLVW